MDKWTRINSKENILNIKTGIDGYRGFVFTCCFSIGIFFACSLIYDRRDIEIIISLILFILFIIMTVFIEKIVYFFHLPTNHLIITKEMIIFKKRKKTRKYVVKDTTINFKSFFEDFQPSLLYLKTFDKEDYVLITKKQYTKIKKFLI